MLTHTEASPRPPRRVVVIGASGFVGGDLVRHLRELDIACLPLSSADVDLRRPDAAAVLDWLVEEGDSVVIISALTPDKGKDAATLLANLAMGQQLGAWLWRARPAQVLYVSSDSVYDDAAALISERTPCAPQTFHGLMHLTRERMLLAAAAASGAPLAILRPSLLYGARDTHNGYGPNRFLRSAREERRIALFGGGEERRDHVFIGDVSRLIGLCLCHGSRGVLNVATGVSVSFGEVARLVAALWEPPAVIESRPRAGPVTHRHFDIADRVKAFPTFRFTSLREGLATCVATELVAHE